MNLKTTNAVIGAVGLVLIVSIIGIIVLAVVGNAIPDVLQNVAVGALTGLVGLLVPTEGKQAVEVTNEPLEVRNMPIDLPEEWTPIVPGDG